MASVGEVIVPSANVAVLPRLVEAETRSVAGGWCVVELILQIVTFVTTFVQVVFIHIAIIINWLYVHVLTSIFRYDRIAGGSFFHLEKANVCSIRF